MTIPDITIWHSFLQGDKASLEKLLALHYTQLFNYGSKYSADQELVKDCIQELFLGLWYRRTHLSAQVCPKAYLIASLRRGLHRKLKKEKRFLSFRLHGDASALFNFELSVEDKIIASETLRQQVQAIADQVSTLPRRQKEVIYLKFFQNLSRDEIALIMGNTPQTVSNLMQLALKKLREGLKGGLLMVVLTCCR